LVKDRYPSGERETAPFGAVGSPPGNRTQRVAVVRILTGALCRIQCAPRPGCMGLGVVKNA
jgi:hypothetical protein